jgi:hypothetical protein
MGQMGTRRAALAKTLPILAKTKKRCDFCNKLHTYSIAFLKSIN